MNFLEFIFKLLWQFISFEPGRFEELKEKAFKWRNETMKDIESKDVKESWYHKLLKYDNEWYVQLALAILFVFAFKAVRQWLMSDGSDVDDDDNDSDEDDEVLASAKLAKLSKLIPTVKL